MPKLRDYEGDISPHVTTLIAGTARRKGCPFHGLWRIFMKKLAWLLVAVTLIATLASCSRNIGTELENAFETENVSGGVRIVSYSGSYTKLEIPETIRGKKVVEIGDNVFASSYLLTEITIPNTVVRIGDRAFQGCYALEKIEIPDSVVTIGDYAFFGCWAAKTLHIGASLYQMGRQAIQYCKSLEKITVSEDNTKYAATDDGILFTDNFKTLLCYPAASPAKSYTVPNNCLTIDDYAFRNCANLESVTIGSQVTTIGDGAFYGCSALTDVTLEATVDTIGYFVFAECTALREIAIPEGVESIGYLVEKGECGSVFEGCTALESVTLPKSLTNIYANSFNGCSSLKNVSYRGSEADFKKVVIGKGNTELTDKSVNYNAN